jgi:hypothetical protein
MSHALVSLRALVEALLWGSIGGAAYWLVISFASGGGPAGIMLVGIPAVIGMMVGMVTGLVGAIVAGTLSMTDVSDRTCRVIAGLVSGTCVTGVCLLLFGHDDPTLGSWLDTPQTWLQLVVGPGLIAVAVGAWRGPAILRWRVPRPASGRPV